MTLFLSLACLLSAPLRADTPTSTATISPSPTVTVTPTPAVGEGGWNIVPESQPLVTGSTGHSAVLSYQAGPTAWPASGGLLTIFFPLGLDAPAAGNFYAAPAYASKIQGPITYSGQTVTVQVKNLAPYESLGFYYGYNPTGLAVSTTNSPLSFGVAAYVGSVSAGPGAVVTPNGASSVAVVTPTMTATITPTFTISTTFSPTPTISQTCTITQTFTETPIGAEQPKAVYSYPNPYDLSNFSKCTFRFPFASSASVTVFNLVGEPVRQIPDTDINALQGWAVWPGVDDYLRKVAGGLYFVRVTTPNGVMVKHFTVLH